MPIPFILAGAGLFAGAIGIGGHMNAKETNEKAEKRADEAQRLYDNAKKSLEEAQKITEKSLLKLGNNKKSVLETDMKSFLVSYDKIKHINIENTIGMNELSSFKLDQQDEIELKKLTDIYSSAVQSGATGAAAGAVIALAASGTLPIVAGGLDIAGSLFMVGEFGAAAGIAGSALSLGAAMTPLAAVAAPVIMFTGVSASIKADENLEKANTYYAEAEAAVEKMKTSEVLCGAISKRSDMFDDLLSNLNKMFKPCVKLLGSIVRKKEGYFIKKKLTANDFTEQELKLIGVTRALAGAVKAVIDMPLLEENGTLSDSSEKKYEKNMEELPKLSLQSSEILSCFDYNEEIASEIDGMFSEALSSIFK